MPYSFITFDYSVKAKCIWLLILVMTAAKANAQEVKINDSIVTILTSASPEQTIKQINLSALQFNKASGNRIDFGLVGSGYKYILLKLNSPSTLADQCLSIDNTSLDTVSIYRIYNDGTSRLLYQGGSLVAFDTRRNYVWHTVPVEINKDPSFYLVALKAPQKNINVTYEILSQNHLVQTYQHYERLVFFYLGIVSMIIAIIVFAFILFKKKVFLAYLGYVTCVSIWIFSHYGRIFPYIYPHIPLLNDIIKPVSTLGASLLLIIVLYLVFKQQLQSQRWLKHLFISMIYILLLLTGSMLLLLIPNLNGNVRAMLMAAWHFGLMFSMCIVVFTPLYYIRSGSTAKIFSIAMFVISVMAMVQIFANFGYNNNFFINEHGVTVGSLLEISIMAFGLFYSLLEEKKQRETQVLALEQEQTETFKKLITVQDNERKRIAGDLHDNIGPLLAALKINFRRIIHAKDTDVQDGLINKTESIIDDSIAEIRNVAHNLMPKGLSSKGLINTLNEYFESIQQLYNKTIVFNHEIQLILNPDLQMNVYRIICELVLNAARHSDARMITVCITANEKIISIIINDDGQGFKAKLGDHKKSLGLNNAESRILYLKGKFHLKTNPGEGTAIVMEIPLQFYEAKINGF